MIGIYQIQSIIKPDRIYIGSSENINERWINHLSELRNNKHHSIKLQNHYNKYGKNDLIFSILIQCDVDSLISTEQFYIDELHPWFNICKIAASCKGLKRSPETCKKIKDSKLGKKHPCPWLNRKGFTAWNKGLTKETDDRVNNISKNMIGNTNTLNHKWKRSK